MSIAHMHAEGYAAILGRLPGVELIGFSDGERERAKQFAQTFELPWFERHQELVEAGVDAVIICSENAGRLELVELAAGAGAHVLCEKPIEVSLDEARALGEACERNGVLFMTAFPMRFDASVRSVKTALERGELGRLHGINGVNHAEMPARHRAWFAQRELAGGGAVMDHTVHLVDLMRWFLGCEVSEVYAEVGNPFQQGELDVDSAGLISLAFEDGTCAAIDCSWSRPAGYPRWGHLKMELVGDRGALSLDAFAQSLTVYSGRQERNPSWHGWGSDPNVAMLEEFVSAVREMREPAVSWRDGYEALRVALACYESAERGQPVSL
ncbi:MAG: Gfo/Idh/MocA family oxidoreductase [Trueperaceae bacterium]